MLLNGNSLYLILDVLDWGVYKLEFNLDRGVCIIVCTELNASIANTGITKRHSNNRKPKNLALVFSTPSHYCEPQ